ncbi:MAG: T9SS type A sorting domain-containing protein [candidate division WOR-3 bacterium]
MSIGSIILENSVKLSKNPSEGLVNLTLCLVEPGDAWISVYDHTGSLIKREGLGFLKAGEHPYSLSLSPGIYFLIAQVGQWSETKRVIVR